MSQSNRFSQDQHSRSDLPLQYQPLSKTMSKNLLKKDSMKAEIDEANNPVIVPKLNEAEFDCDRSQTEISLGTSESQSKLQSSASKAFTPEQIKKKDPSSKADESPFYQQSKAMASFSSSEIDI